MGMVPEKGPGPCLGWYSATGALWTGQLGDGGVLGRPLGGPKSLPDVPCEVCIMVPGMLLELCIVSPWR
jgi:hypothetical protein